MTATDHSASALGLALLALAATTAGFLTASIPTASTDAGATTIPPGQARALEPSPAEVRLAPDAGGPVQLVLFDGNGSYLRSIHVDGDEQATVPGEPGEELVLVVPASSEPAEVAWTGEAAPSVDRVQTRATPRTLVVGQDERVDAELSLSVPNRPASVSLAIDGTVRGLHVDVRTSEGPVLRQTNETNEDGEPGRVRFLPDHLTNGTYRVSVQADHLDGRLSLVTRTLELPERTADLEVPDPRIRALGAPVARVQEGEAWLLPSSGTSALALAFEQGGWADVRVYAPDHRLANRVQIGEEGPAWQWSGNGSADPGYDAVEVEAGGGPHTVFVDTVEANTDASVYVVLPDRETSPPARPADVQTRTVEITYPPPTETAAERTVRFAGGLVDVSVAGGEGAASDRRILVEGERGILLDRHDQAAGDDAGVITQRSKHVERFGPQPVDVRVEADAATGSVRLAFEHYVP